MPDISVILPTYNRRQYVDEAIRSVLAQHHVDFELIIVDDCSTDGTYEYLRDRYGDHRQIQIIKTPKNGGPSAAKNAAIRVAAAPLVTLLCDDDAFRIDALAAATNLMAVREDVSFAWFAVAKFDRLLDDSHLIAEDFADVPLLDDPVERELAWARSNPGDGHLLVVRRECYESIDGYADELQAMGDTDLLLRLMRHFDYTCDRRVLVNVRLHDSGQTVRNNALRASMYRLFLARNEKSFRRAPDAYTIWLRGAAVRYFVAGRRWEARRSFLEAIVISPRSWASWKRWIALERKALRVRFSGNPRTGQAGISA